MSNIVQKKQEEAILIVDDQEVGRDVLTDFLHMFDYEVKVASSGEEALKYFDQYEFKIIFMDLMMPVMDGYELAREVRRREATLEEEPVILVASSSNIYVDLRGNVSQRELEKLERNGFNHCLPKPLKKDRLKDLLDDINN